LVDGPPERGGRLVTAPHPTHVVTGLVLGAGWAIVLVAVAGSRERRRAQRLPRALGPTVPASGAGAARRLGGLVVALGAAIRRLARWPRQGVTAAAAPSGLHAEAARAGLPDGRRPRDLSVPAPPADPSAGDHDIPGDADRRIGVAALAVVGLAALAPILAVVPLTWAVVTPVLAARRARARHDARLHDQLPDVVDLLTLTTAAGLPVGAALLAIADRPGGPLGAALARAAAHLRHGGSTADGLAHVAALGPTVRPLVDALVRHDRYGTPLLPALERVAIEARARRRRRAEEAARRLPVTLLLPLVLTVFPAFVLLTVVPLLAGSLGSLSLTST
jgi:tight adherence protein C